MVPEGSLRHDFCEGILLPGMSTPLLDVRNLTFEVNGQRILDSLDLLIQEQEIHALLGANGSGKSTLAYVLMGCEGYVPTTGILAFRGEDLRPISMHERARRGITLAWQEAARFEGITVREYVTLGRSDVDPVPSLELVGLSPDRYLDRCVDKALSGGERHRIELASVVAMHPTLAILDEPGAGIDMLSIRHVVEVIRSLKCNGASVLLITHQEEVASIADRASQLCAGRIVCSGKPEAVVDHYRGRTCVRCDGVECRDERA